MDSDKAKKPEIVYPCQWTYAIIGLTEEYVITAIEKTVGDLEHNVTFSARSSKGKYHSYHLDVRVEDEAHRNRIFVALKRCPGIKMVL